MKTLIQSLDELKPLIDDVTKEEYYIIEGTNNTLHVNLEQLKLMINGLIKK